MQLGPRHNRDESIPLQGKEYLNPDDFRRIRNSLKGLAETQGQAYMLSQLVGMYEELQEEPLAENPRLGVFSETGTVEGEGWARFVWFDDAADSTLERYLGPDARILRGQLQFARDSHDAQGRLQGSFHGILNVHEFLAGSAEGNAMLWAQGSVADPGGESSHEIHLFASRLGMEDVWEKIRGASSSFLRLTVDGYINGLSEPIAAALENWNNPPSP